MCPRCLLHQLWIFANSAIVAGLRHHRTVGRGGSLERVQFSQASLGAECCDHFPHVRCSCQAGRPALQGPFGGGSFPRGVPAGDDRYSLDDNITMMFTRTIIFVGSARLPALVLRVTPAMGAEIADHAWTN